MDVQLGAVDNTWKPRSITGCARKEWRPTVYSPRAAGLVAEHGCKARLEFEIVSPLLRTLVIHPRRDGRAR